MMILMIGNQFHFRVALPSRKWLGGVTRVATAPHTTSVGAIMELVEIGSVVGSLEHQCVASIGSYLTNVATPRAN